MAFLPDELWDQALHLGVQRQSLGHEELCRLAMVSRRFRRLCNQDSLWKGLWEEEFGRRDQGGGRSEPGQKITSGKGAPNWKAIYRIRCTPVTLCCLTVFSGYDTVKNALRMAHMRVVLAVKSEISGLQHDCNNLQRSIDSEKTKLSTLCVDHSHIKHARRARAALQIWQPQVVRTRHEKLIEQQPLDIDSQCHLLEMEIRVCRNLISTYERGLAQKRSLIEMRVNRLEFLSKSPLQVSLDRMERSRDSITRSFGRKRKRKGEENGTACVAGGE